MLKFNFKRVCKMRGIEKPYSFFMKLGISHTIASHMATDKLNKILLRHLLNDTSAYENIGTSAIGTSVHQHIN